MQTYLWLILGGVLLVVELSTGTVYLLMLALACVPAWFTHLLGMGFLTQCFVYALTASGLLWIGRRYCQNMNGSVQTSADDLDQGAVVRVTHWQQGIGLAHYRGAPWQVVHVSNPNTKPVLEAGDFRIVRLEGTRLVVEPL